MGRPLALFASQPPALALCSHCEEVLYDPVWVCYQEHVECRQCYNQHGGCTVCAEMGEEVEQEQPFVLREAAFVKRFVDELESVCTNKGSGCSWTGKLGDQGEHQTKCGFKTILCPTDCGIVLLVKDRRVHRRSACPLQKLACRRGIIDGEQRCIYPRKDAETHDDTCCYFECPGKECTTKGTRPAIHDHQQGCESLHRKLSRVSEELEHVEEEHRAKAAKHAEQVDELQDELENCQYEVSALEEAQEQTSGDLYTVARRLRTLEEHVGLQYTVDVDDDDGTAILLLNEAFDVHQPAPLALDVLVPFAQPPAVAGAVHAGAPDDAYENFDLDFDTRAIANPSKSQQKLRQRLVASLKAAKLAEKAAESSEMEVDEDEAPLEAQLGAGAMQVGGALNPHPFKHGPILPAGMEGQQQQPRKDHFLRVETWAEAVKRLTAEEGPF